MHEDLLTLIVINYRLHTVIHEKRGSTFVIITLENLDGFLIILTCLETGMNTLCKYLFYM